MFPDVAGNGELDLTVAEVRVEVYERGVFADTGGVEKAGDGILRWLSTDDDLISIRNHPDGWIMCHETLSAEGEGIGEPDTANLVSKE
jgi:hypothetical protein